MWFSEIEKRLRRCIMFRLSLFNIEIFVAVSKTTALRRSLRDRLRLLTVEKVNFWIEMFFVLVYLIEVQTFFTQPSLPPEINLFSIRVMEEKRGKSGVG